MGATRGAGGESRRSRPQARERGRPAVEWFSLATSVAIVLALVGLLLYEHVSRGSGPPVIEVLPRPAETRRAADDYYLPVDITNRGDVAAGEVRVEVSLHTADGQRETSDATVQLLAGHATHRATFVFRRDPSAGTVVARVLNFQEQ